MADVFRRNYGVLTDEQKKQGDAIKAKAEELLALIGKPEDRSEKSRCLAVAKTKLEEAVMWAVKGVFTTE